MDQHVVVTVTDKKKDRVVFLKHLTMSDAEAWINNKPGELLGKTDAYPNYAVKINNNEVYKVSPF